MSKFIEMLRALNRKERFHLVGFALDNPDFTLGPSFRLLVQEEFHRDVPDNAFVAMDYHLSWLYAAAVIAREERIDGQFPAGGGIELGNQEDADLVIAFDEDDVTRLIILEAKGVTGWSNSQLQSKVRRLRETFGDGLRAAPFPAVLPDFGIVSPLRPTRLDTSAWPAWMKQDDGQPHWIHMRTPDTLMKITRCDAVGVTNKAGGFWKAEPDKVSLRQRLPSQSSHQ